MDCLHSPAAGVAALLTVFLFWLVLRKKFTSRPLPLPPGPKGLPFLGSALDINKTEPWLTYREWKKAHGEIVSCTLLGETYIIINSDRVVNALLYQRSNIYSDRPVIRTSTLFGIDFNTGHLGYGETWKIHRKMLHQTLGTSMIPKYHESLTEKARELAMGLLHSPEDFEEHTRTFSASIIMSITYGYNVAPRDDRFLKPYEEFIKITTLTTPERALLFNLFPILLHLPSWFPGAEFHRLAERCRELSPKVRDGPFQFVKDCLANNIENNSMVAQLLREETVEAKDRAAYEQNIKDATSSGFIAGTDTTRSTVNTFIMALILWPEVQDRAQAEIDRVVGRDRLPSFDDLPSLPYIDALLLETMRWGPLVPMAVPHMVTKDDIFEQYFIPKGTVIIPNLWGMAHDEERFPNPESFKPERHLDADGKLLPVDLSSICYGFGRRICPGRYLADASIRIAFATMLFMFRFSKAVGPDGSEIEVSPKFVGGVSRQPASFLCCIKPRFKGAKEILTASQM